MTSKEEHWIPSVTATVTRADLANSADVQSPAGITDSPYHFRLQHDEAGNLSIQLTSLLTFARQGGIDWKGLTEKGQNVE